jgi:hypothetical protein
MGVSVKVGQHLLAISQLAVLPKLEMDDKQDMANRQI